MKLISGILLGAAILIGSCNREPEDGQKNVLFIVVDDLNNTIGCYGHETVQTPNIDRLAGLGIKFNQAYCNYSVCNPSRSSLLTGLRPETIGVLDNRISLNSVLNGRVTLPQLFRNNGYHTVSIGKIFHGNSERNDPLAWDEEYQFKTAEAGRQGEGRNITSGELKWCNWLMAEGTDDDQQDGQNALKAIEFILSEHDKPFFLALGFAKPHDPFHAPKKYYDLYPLENCDPPPVPARWAPSYPHSLPGETAIFNKFSEQDKREFLRSYYACTSFMDAQLGKVIEALEESGEMENTLIVFFGDHGYHLGEHNWWNKVTIYQKGHHAPMIIVDPGNSNAGKETDAMIEFVDIYPTLAGLCGLDPVPGDLQGKSFASILDHPEQSFRTEVRAIVNRGEMIGRTVKNSSWRYIEWAEGEQGFELYDQVNDPIEYQDLAGDPAYEEVLKEMKRLIEE